MFDTRSVAHWLVYRAYRGEGPTDGLQTGLPADTACPGLGTRRRAVASVCGQLQRKQAFVERVLTRITGSPTLRDYTLKSARLSIRFQGMAP